ncbi:hypothetical protein BST81_02270 [Leptolyngbya sp. 'hensonii']|uniref:hypothetical protein n=1 Tax=Leptolyngbya sp. 'hensonii' TaxID=1922337 RepID=UPI000950247A|nr:hypothetical protein [Leptolyngbya sp. 'hensonii']OLP20084.1 hypothetical protein BST81_02270 [Leptolyngbya sp. 'hensonii']
MKLFNLDLITNIILPGLWGSTAWSILIALVVGVSVGGIIGAIRRRLKQTLLPAIAGSFLGTMLLGMLPILSVPGIVGGGAYGGILILFIATFTVPVGAIGGAVSGSLLGTELLRKYGQKLALILLAGTYSFMTLVIYTSVTLHCSRPNTLPLYCSQAGYPERSRPGH